MKKERIIIISILGILLIVGGSVVYFSGMMNGKDPEPTASPSPSPTPNDEMPSDDEIIDYYEKIEYICIKPGVKETLEGTDYAYTYQNQYYFMAQDGKLVTAKLTDHFKFDSEEGYQAFLKQEEQKETNFTLTQDEENLIIDSSLYTIFYPENVENIDEFVFDENYLAFLSQKGYICELQKTTTNEN